MKSKEIFPFVKNNYFSGKQLTARDFKEEQNYSGNKLRALRYSLCGAGVAAGLDVVAIDVNMLSIESGYAFDGCGRDIVVPSPVLKNIETIDGFNSIDTGQPVYLCIEYKETPIEPTSPVSDSERSEYNRISEGYRLFLTNRRPINLSCGLKGLIETAKEIFYSDRARVIMTVPKYVNIDEKLIIKITTEKRGLNSGLSTEFEIRHENFFNGEENSSFITYYNAADAYDVQTDTIALTPSRSGIGLNTISVSAENINIVIGGDKQTIQNEIKFETEIIEDPTAERIRKEFFYSDIEPLAKGICTEHLYLAEIDLSFINGKGTVIEKVKTMPFEQYIMSERLMYLLQNIPRQPKEEIKSAPEPAVVYGYEREANDYFSCGVESIDIDVDYKGKVYYSSEIIHGLGEGSVNYTIGVEPICGTIHGTDETILFGDPALFAGSQYNMDFPNLQYSIISYNDKGTFRIAVKLLDRVGAGNIKLHWQAVKAKEHEERDMIEIERVTISIKPNLVNIEPRESVSLECVIEGCDNPNCIWNVEDKNGGTISRSGVYKAPSAEGVYTVTASSVKYPTKKAVNYIIVSKKREI